MIKEILKRIDRAGDYIANGIESAIWVSAWRVTGPEQVKQRDRLALGYLYQGFRNAKRQIFRDIGMYHLMLLGELYNPHRAIEDSIELEGGSR